MAESVSADVLIRFTADAAELQTAFESAAEGLDEVKEKTEEASGAAEDMSSSVGATGGSLRGISPILSLLHPKLGRFASAAFGGSRAAKAFGISAGTLVTALGAAAAAGGALYGIYYTLTAATRETARATEFLAEAEEKLNVIMAAGADIKARNQMLLGLISEAEFEAGKRAEQTAEQFRESASQQNTQLIEQREELDKLIDRRAALKRETALSIFNPAQLAASAAQLNVINAKIDGQRQIIAGLNDNWLATVGKVADYRAELDLAADLANDVFVGPLLEDAGPALTPQAGVNRELEKTFDLQNLIIDGIARTDTHNHNSHENAMARYEARQKHEQWLLDNAKTVAENNDAEAAKDKKRNDERVAANIAGTMQMISAASMLNAALGQDAAKQFKIQKALSLSEVAFNTAEAITEAAPNPFLIAGAAAIGAAQVASIMAQQPPPTAHMGSVGSRDPLSPDEGISRRVMSGESILDRAATRRLGGEKGIRSILNGGSPGGATTYVVPYKHMDRYLGNSAKGNNRFTRALRRANQITDGQRGW